jgi:hypothetical protein
MISETSLYFYLNGLTTILENSKEWTVSQLIQLFHLQQIVGNSTAVLSEVELTSLRRRLQTLGSRESTTGGLTR